MADITKINLKGTLLTIKDQYAYHNGDLATVATSGSYNDLEDKPDIAAAQVNSDWNATSGVAQILNKPDIPEDLGDLTNNAGYTKNTGTITGITMNGISKGTSGVVNLGTVITAHQDISGKANTADLATVAMSGSYDDLSNKPTIPAAQVNSDWNASTGKAAILNKPIIPVGIANATTSEDGTWTMTLSNGEYITIDLNHEHPQYVESDDLADVATTGSYDDLTDKPTIPDTSSFVTTSTLATALQGKADTSDIPTKVSDLTNDSGFTSNAGTITGITMNGASKGTSGVVDLGTVVTDVSGKANASEMDVSTSGDQTTITLKTGTSATVINQHQSLSGRVQSTDVTNIVVCASQTAYDNISPKDSNTLYLIKE